MSYLHTNWVRDDIEFRGLKEDGKTIVPMMDTFPRAIMYALASRANKGGYCEVSQEDLAGDTGMSVRSVRRYIKKIPTTVLQIIRQGGSPKTEERYPTQFRVMYPGNSNDPGPVDRGQRNGNDKFMEATPVCQSTTPDYQTGVPRSSSPPDPGQSVRPLKEEENNKKEEERIAAVGKSSVSVSDLVTVTETLPLRVEERGEEIDDPGTPRLRQKAVNGFKGEVPDKAGREEPYRFDRDLDMSKSTGQDFDFLRKKYVSLKKDVADYMYKASAKYKEDHPNWSKQPMTNGYFDDWLGLKLIEEQMAAAPPTPKLQPVADVPW